MIFILIVAALARQFPFYKMFASQIQLIFPKEESFLASKSCFSSFMHIQGGGF